jgi:hypothetical protein
MQNEITALIPLSFVPLPRSGSSLTRAGLSFVIPPLRNNLPHHIPKNISQPKIPPIMPEGQLLMIEPHQMQQRRVQIMHMHPIPHREMPKLIRLAQ